MPDVLKCVLTTIQPPTDSVLRLVGRLEPLGVDLIVIGDTKGPASYPAKQCRLYTVADQLELGFELAPLLPTRHYARKNVGYLVAMSEGATCIYETDDDNAPNARWSPRSCHSSCRAVAGSGWVNVYRYFSNALIWPRGLPLERVTSAAAMPALAADETVEIAPIQQGLADGSPDVDAVWRLILDGDFRFADGPGISLPRGAWCPFNSQSTWWWREAFPLMYLPSFCSFRMTDIWRSFVAQRCLWELGRRVVFHTAEVEQVRNPHSYLKDFEDEIPGYLQNAKIAALLEAIELRPGPGTAADNLRICYERLVAASILPSRELPLVEAWIRDVGRVAS